MTEADIKREVHYLRSRVISKKVRRRKRNRTKMADTSSIARLLTSTSDLEVLFANLVRVNYLHAASDY